eukprot:1086086-Prymnesium_polylepis.1
MLFLERHGVPLAELGLYTGGARATPTHALADRHAARQRERGVVGAGCAARLARSRAREGETEERAHACEPRAQAL